MWTSTCWESRRQGCMPTRSLCGQSLFALPWMLMSIQRSSMNLNGCKQINVLLDCLPATAKCYVEGARPRINMSEMLQLIVYKDDCLFVCWYTPFGNQHLYNTEQSQAFLRRRPMTTPSPDIETIVISKG